MQTSSQQDRNFEMYGVNDIDSYIKSLVQTTTYNGLSMIIAGLMSNAQEQLEGGDNKNACKTLNIAKEILFRAFNEDLTFSHNKH